jgi:hypothetical protein
MLHILSLSVTYKKLREQLIRILTLLAYDQEVTASGFACGRPSAAATQSSRLEVKQSVHWPADAGSALPKMK